MTQKTPIRPAHLAALFQRIGVALLLPWVVASPAASFAQSTIGVRQDAPTGLASSPTLSRLTPQLLHQLLIAELQVISNEPGQGFQLTLEAARKTGDERFYARAVEIALEAGAGDSALMAARAWMSATPKSIAANRQLATVLGATGRVSDMTEPLRTLISLTSAKDRAALILSMPSFFRSTTDSSAMLRVLELALAPTLTTSGTAGAGWAVIASVKTAQPDLPGALTAVESGFNIEPVSVPLGLVAAKLAEFTPMVDATVEAFLRRTANIDVHASFARALIQGQRYPAAKAQLETLLARHPSAASGWLMLAALHQQNGELKSAEFAAKRHLDLTSPQEGQAMTESQMTSIRAGQMQAYLVLAHVAEKRKDFVLAQAWLDKIGDADEVAALTLRRASLLAKQGKLADALAMIRAQPVRNKSDERSIDLAQITLLREVGENAKAYEALKSMVAQHGASPDLSYELAMVAEKLNDLDAFEGHLRDVIAKKPLDANAYNALGYAWADRGVNLAEAKKLIRRAVELAPGDAYILDSLGWVEFRMGNALIALDTLQQAFKMARDAEIAAHLGEVLWQLGRQSEAKVAWQQGRTLNRDNETLNRTLQRFGIVLN